MEACLRVREREIESSCNSISPALPLGRHSPPPERPTCPRPTPPCPAVSPFPVPPLRPFASLRVGELSEVSESYPQPGRFPSRGSTEYYPRHGGDGVSFLPAERNAEASAPPTIRFLPRLPHSGRRDNYFSVRFLSSLPPVSATQRTGVASATLTPELSLRRKLLPHTGLITDPLNVHHIMLFTLLSSPLSVDGSLINLLSARTVSAIPPFDIVPSGVLSARTF